MLHLKNSDYSPTDTDNLLSKARNLCAGLDVIIRDTRVSSKYVEYDISIPKEQLDELVKRLQPIAKLDHAKHVVEEHFEKDEAIRKGIFYFNNERYWECHEVLEGVWKKCYEGEKDLVQGLILVAAAMVHYQKNENDICLSIFERALQKLANTSGNYNNIDIDSLRRKAEEIRKTRKITTFAI